MFVISDSTELDVFVCVSIFAQSDVPYLVDKVSFFYNWRLQLTITGIKLLGTQT